MQAAVVGCARFAVLVLALRGCSGLDYTDHVAVTGAKDTGKLQFTRRSANASGCGAAGENYFYCGSAASWHYSGFGFCPGLDKYGEDGKGLVISWTRNGGGSSDSLEMCKSRCLSISDCKSVLRDSSDGECILYRALPDNQQAGTYTQGWGCFYHGASLGEVPSSDGFDYCSTHASVKCPVGACCGCGGCLKFNASGTAAPTVFTTAAPTRVSAAPTAPPTSMAPTSTVVPTAVPTATTSPTVAISCTSWRQTAGCSSSGAREAGNDEGCSVSIQSGRSGFCECENGRKAALTGCEAHTSFTCRAQCATGGIARYGYKIVPFSSSSSSSACSPRREVTSLSECSAAAAALGLSDTSATADGQTQISYDPPWCYFESNMLKFNTGGTNSGPCTATDQCVCKTATPPTKGPGSPARTVPPTKSPTWSMVATSNAGLDGEYASALYHDGGSVLPYLLIAAAIVTAVLVMVIVWCRACKQKALSPFATRTGMAEAHPLARPMAQPNARACTPPPGGLREAHYAAPPVTVAYEAPSMAQPYVRACTPPPGGLKEAHYAAPPIAFAYEAPSMAVPMASAPPPAFNVESAWAASAPPPLAASSGKAAASKGGSPQLGDQILALSRLQQSGVLTQEEFIQAKRKLLTQGAAGAI